MEEFKQPWKMNSFEYIICSAIWFDDGKLYGHQPRNIETGFVISGRRHHNCFATLAITTGRSNTHLNYEKEQGFLTNKDRFVDRSEAAIIAFEANQIDVQVKNLYSENLY